MQHLPGGYSERALRAVRPLCGVRGVRSQGQEVHALPRTRQSQSQARSVKLAAERSVIFQRLFDVYFLSGAD